MGIADWVIVGATVVSTMATAISAIATVVSAYVAIGATVCALATIVLATRDRQERVLQIKRDAVKKFSRSYSSVRELGQGLNDLMIEFGEERQVLLAAQEVILAMTTKWGSENHARKMWALCATLCVVTKMNITPMIIIPPPEDINEH